METLLTIDAAILRWVVTTWRAPWLDEPMVRLSQAGVWGLLFGAIGLGVVLVRRDGLTLMGFWRLVLAIWLANALVVEVLKPLAARTRPFDADTSITVVVRGGDGASMPSGHAATAVAGAMALSLMWPAGRALAWALAVLVMLSRMYLGYHYPSDVLVGAAVGWACCYFATAATRVPQRIATAPPHALRGVDPA